MRSVRPLLFVAATALLAFTFYQHTIAFAAWLAPLLLLLAVRSSRSPAAAAAVAAVAYFAAFVLAARDPVYGHAMSLRIALVCGLAYGLAYLVDALMSRRLRGVARTLVFPAALAAVDFALSRANPFPGFGSPAYSQYGNLALIQIASIGGIWTITYLVGWFASTCAELLEHGTRNRFVAVPFVMTIVAVLVMGGARVATAPRQPAVSIAAITAAAGQDIGDLLQRTQRAARGGAQLVVWSEGAVATDGQDEPALIARAAAVARGERVAILVTLRSRATRATRAVLLGPDGATLLTADKARSLPIDGVRSTGADDIDAAETAHGTIATVISSDADFDDFIRAAGRRGVDILLVPARDSHALREVHAHMAAFRAIENGFAVVRPAAGGLSAAFDAWGRTIAVSDDAHGGVTMFASTPTHNVFAAGPWVRDAFGWICLAMLGALWLWSRAAQPAMRASLSPTGT